MLNVSELMTDPDLAQAFTVYRSTGEYRRGGWHEDSPTELTLAGIITVASEQDLEQIPEADRVKGMMIFRSASPIYQTRNSTTAPGTSDQIKWRNELYRIIKVWPFMDYGFYKAAGVRMTGD